MKIITISREFGSGGRELGKQLADILNFDYYDKEIITAIARKKKIDENYVSYILENHGWRNVPLTMCTSFTNILSMQSMKTDLLIEQSNVINQIASTGKDCVIVGRNADILLKKYQPFNVFVCANMNFKIQRCIEKKLNNEHISKKELERKIREIDKNRARSREFFMSSLWGNQTSYHIIVNTSEWNIKHLSYAIANFSEYWFRRYEQ
ncbi:hypothetical protein HMPREF3073_15510 [Clostridium sp. HMSC19B04]|nr:hypothetical protein HMPREF3073_15510 [Clostridium sp. HMSC19B04]